MSKFPKVISTVKRRRSLSVEEKVEILDAAFHPGGSVAAAADWCGVSRALIYIRRKRARNGLMTGVAVTDAGVSTFAPVSFTPASIASMAVASNAPPHAALPDKTCRPRRLIEVRLINGRTMKADENISLDVLAPRFSSRW